jgi:hypothetical protein
MTLPGSFKLTAFAMVLVACGGGAGPLVSTNGGTGRDDPGSTRDTPPVSSDNANSDCLSCDVTYECPNSGFSSGLSLSSSDGTCTQTLVNVVCSGALFGTGPCTGGGGGAFTCGDVTCTPEQQGLPPQPGGEVDSGLTQGGGG